MNGTLESVWKEVVVVYCRYCTGNWLKGFKDYDDEEVQSACR
jgi:hypothetical protein